MADRTLTDPVPRVLVKEKIADAGVELLRREFEVELGLDWADGELAERIGDFEAILIRSGTKLTADLIDRADRLRRDRPRRHRRRQRRHRGGDQARHHRRQRAGVELGGRRRAHPRDGARPSPQRPAGARLAGRRAMGALRFGGNELYGKTLGVVGFGGSASWSPAGRRRSRWRSWRSTSSSHRSASASSRWRASPAARSSTAGPT